MTCDKHRFQTEWYAAVRDHGQQSPEAITAREAYIAHRQGCASCRAEMMTPKVVTLFSVGVTNYPTLSGNTVNSVTEAG